MMLSACAPKQRSKIDEVRRIEVVMGYEECPQATKPELLPYIATEHLGSKSNVEITIHNDLEQTAYEERLEAENHCYRRQAEQ